jgi:hypothetical protein
MGCFDSVDASQGEASATLSMTTWGFGKTRQAAGGAA